MPFYTGQGNYHRPSPIGGFQFFPPAIKMLLITNAVVFVIHHLGFTIGGMPLDFIFNYYLGLMPLGHGFYIWQLITYQFLHDGFWHIFFNMFFGLWMFGMEVEHMWGSKRFLTFYLLCGVVAGLTQLLLAPILEPMTVERAVPTIGASGAVYGVLVAFAMLFPDRYIYIYFLLPLKAKYFIFGLIVLGVFSVGSQSTIANLAHLGGALTGYVYILILTKRFPLHDAVERLGWWLNSRRYKRTEQSHEDIVDAKVYEINEKPKTEQELNQKKVDEILDKISIGGYQSLTEEEKRILFEASKKLN
jgi:membrane associated rhomboid family serine protease